MEEIFCRHRILMIPATRFRVIPSLDRSLNMGSVDVAFSSCYGLTFSCIDGPTLSLSFYINNLVAPYLLYSLQVEMSYIV